MGFNIGTRIVDEFFAKNTTGAGPIKAPKTPLATSVQGTKVAKSTPTTKEKIKTPRTFPVMYN